MPQSNYGTLKPASAQTRSTSNALSVSIRYLSIFPDICSEYLLFLLFVVVVERQSYPVTVVAFSPNSELLASAAHDRLHIWSVKVKIQSNTF